MIQPIGGIKYAFNVHKANKKISHNGLNKGPKPDVVHCARYSRLIVVVEVAGAHLLSKRTTFRPESGSGYVKGFCISKNFLFSDETLLCYPFSLLFAVIV